MRRFLESDEPYDDAFDGNAEYTTPAFSSMRMAGLVMLVTTIASYLLFFWQAQKRRRREETKTVINKTLDDEASFPAIAPYTAANAANRQFGGGDISEGFNGDLALRNIAVEEQRNHHTLGGEHHPFPHGVFSHLSKVRNLWMDPSTTTPARRIHSVGGPNHVLSDDEQHAPTLLEPNHKQAPNTGNVNYIDPMVCDGGDCGSYLESGWIKFAAMQQLGREREHPFDEASSVDYDPLYGSKYSLPTDEEAAY